MKNKIKINQICRYCGKRCVKSTTDEIHYDVIYSLKTPFGIEEKLKYHKSCAVKYHRQKAIIKRETEQNLLNKPHVSKSDGIEREALLKAFYDYVDMNWANGMLTRNVDEVINGFKSL